MILIPEMTQSFIKKYKIISFAPLILFLIIYLFLWSPLPERPLDPWYKAARLLDSADNVSDVRQRSILIGNAGNQLKELSEKHPYHGRVHLLLARYYNKVRLYDSAIAAVDRALEQGGGSLMNPLEREAFSQLSLAYFNKSNYEIKSNQVDKAIETAKTGIKRLPKDPGLYSQLAIAQHKKNDLGNAVINYEKVLEFTPDNENARANLLMIYKFMGNNYLDAGNPHAARRNYESALKYAPKDKEAIAGLISATKQLGDNEGLNKLIKKYSQVLNAE